MCVMPFGLVNSQATFQRLMDNTLQGLNRTESYIDDCIIYSCSFEEHLKDLRADTSNFASVFREEVEFLGHVVSKEGRRPLVSAAKGFNVCTGELSKLMQVLVR